MVYKVLVIGEPLQTFSIAESALDYATRHVYLDWKKGSEFLSALKEGKSIVYSYGFKEVQIVTEK
jgi:hypothetical protein